MGLSRWRGVVKVQLSLTTSEAVPQALIYDATMLVFFSGDSTPDLVERMAGRPRAFMHAHLDEDGVVILEEDATEEEF